MALYFKKANKRGAIAGIIVGIFLRFGGGEPIFSIPPFIPYPMEDPIDGIQFPFRTFSMICSLISILIVSLLFPIKKTN